MTVKGRIELRASVWREGGEWRVALTLPPWLAIDMAGQMQGRTFGLAMPPDRIEMDQTGPVVVTLTPSIRKEQPE